MKSQILMAAVCAFALACNEDTDPLTEMTVDGKGFYPVSGNTFVDLVNGGTISANRIYAPNVNLSFELQYWSEAPIQEINMYATIDKGAKTKIFNKPYTEIAAFSKIKSADTLVMAYKTPVVLVETPVRLDVEIVNENGLSVSRTLTIKSKP